MNSLDINHPGAGGVREMIAIALPMVVSHGCDTAMTFTDRMFLSRLGPVTMSAAMGGGLSCYLMMTFFMGLIGYTTALAAQYLGAGRKDRCAVAATQGLIIAALAYPVILLCRPLGHAFFGLMEISAEQLAPQKVYFNIMLYATIIGLVRSALSGFFSGVGRTKVVMFAAFGSMGVNIVMNYVLVFGKCGFPAMGIRGAAYGTVIGGVFGIVLLIAAYFRRSVREEFGVTHAFRLDWPAMKALLKFGYPSGCEMFLNFLAFTVLVMTYQSYDAQTAAAITVVFNWDMVAFVPMIGAHIGVVSLVGRYMGAGQPDIAHRATMSGLKLTCLYAVVILILFAGFAGPLVAVFRPSEVDPVYAAAEPLAVFMLRMAALYVISDAIILVFSGALRGAGDTFWAMCISVGFHWMFVPIVMLMLRVWNCSPRQAWSVMVVVIIIFSGVFYLRYRSGKWRTIKVIGPPAELPVTGDSFHEPPDM